MERDKKTSSFQTVQVFKRRYLSDVLMVGAGVLLHQKELVPHPAPLGAVKNPASSLAVRQSQRLAYIPRQEGQGGGWPEQGQHPE